MGDLTKSSHITKPRFFGRLKLQKIIMKVDPEVFQVYSISVSLLVIKTMFMAFLTGKARLSNKVFANPEDAKDVPGSKVGSDPDVERVRRAHLNDLENIPLFIAIAAVYMVAVQPSVETARILFYGFAAARFLHTYVYLNEIEQPYRGLAFIGGVIICQYMALHVFVASLM